MQWIKRSVGLIVIVTLLGAFATAGAQTTKAEYEAKIAQLQAKIQELVDKMQQASEQRNTADYEASKVEYEKIKEQVTILKEEFASKNNTEAQGKKAYNDGRRAFQTRQYDQAISSFDKAIGLLPDFAKAYTMKGLALRYSHRYDEAEIALKKAIEIDASDYMPYSYLGGLYKSMDRADDAISQYRIALSKDSSRHDLYYHIGQTYVSKKKDYTNAIMAFEKAIEINPQYVKGYVALGDAYTNSGNLKKAVNALTTATTLDGRNGMGWYRLTDALIKSNKYQQTIDAGNKALQNAGRQRKIKAPVHVNMGQAYESLGDKANALKHYQEAAKDRRYAQWANWAIDKLKKQ